MKVVRAEEMGMCFGVRDALQIASKLPSPSNVTIYGELVHNPVVEQQLATAGFHQVSENGRNTSIDTPVVMITAHGISEAERAKLQSSGKQLVDTTCPLVQKAHTAAIQLRDDGRHVVLIGKAGHVEVQGIVEDLHSYSIIEKPEQVETYDADRLGVVCQTTMPTAVVDEIVTHIKQLNPESDIRFIDTVCRPTKLRQMAMQSLLDAVDTVVVVGGRNSNNTRRLVQLCADRGATVFHVENADQLKPAWFEEVDVVGLTAGTSTLDTTIDAVQQRLESF